MSNALAIAGVTAVLRDLLDSGMIEHKVTDAMGQGVTVSTIAPDAIALSDNAKPRLNLFLHQVTPNAAWRNFGYPSRDGRGVRVSNVPLALDLHYLLTAYGSTDLQAEVLLGYAVQLLHETPVLPRTAIRSSLNPPSPPVTGGLLPSIYQALRASDLADQIEQIKITPAMMNTEELSKLWTALQAHYRPTVTYLATVVLIDSIRATRSTLPVLTRGPVDPLTKQERGVAVQPDTLSPYPQIDSITLPKAQIAALLGDTIELDGHNLDGSNHALLLSHPRLSIDNRIPTASSVTPAAVKFTLTDDPANYPAGVYTLTLELVRGGDPAPRLTNELALPIAPQITSLPITAALDVHGDLTLTPTCKPTLRPSQRVSLIVGAREAFAEAFDTATPTPTFVFRAMPSGTYWVRLRVDGVDSLLIDRSTSPPTFGGPSITVTP